MVVVDVVVVEVVVVVVVVVEVLVLVLVEVLVLVLVLVLVVVEVLVVVLVLELVVVLVVSRQAVASGSSPINNSLGLSALPEKRSKMILPLIWLNVVLAAAKGASTEP